MDTNLVTSDIEPAMPLNELAADLSVEHPGDERPALPGPRASPNCDRLRRLDSIDKIVIGLYARGMTVRDIRAHLAEIYDVEVSPDLISTITDAVLEEVRDWQARPLDRVYPVIFLDALICKVRTEGTVRNKAAHLAVGIDVDGRKEVLGIWVEAVEGAKFWLRVMNDLKSRGVEDVLIVVCDGLTGLPARSRPSGPRPSCRPASCT